MDEVLERLTGLITGVPQGWDGKLRLPTERELAATLGVSRGTLRERLNTLETLGALRRTQGSGTYVELPSSSFLRLYFEIAVKVGSVDLTALEETRELVEIAAVAQAAERRSDQDVARLERWVTQMLHGDSAADGDEADFHFHLDLVHMAGNAVLALIVEGLARILRDLLADRRQVVRQLARLEGAEGPSPNDLVHRTVLEGIRDRDPQAASEAMREHFRLWREASARVAAQDIPAVTELTPADGAAQRNADDHDRDSA